MRTTKILLLGLLLALASALAACAANEAFVRGTVLEGAEFEQLWDRTKEVMAEQGYRSDPQLTRRAEKEIVSLWQTQLAPSRFDGKRRRVHVRFVEMEKGEWRADVWIEQDRNTEIGAPLNPFAADWEVDPDADGERCEHARGDSERDSRVAHATEEDGER